MGEVKDVEIEPVWLHQTRGGNICRVWGLKRAPVSADFWLKGLKLW